MNMNKYHNHHKIGKPCDKCCCGQHYIHEKCGGNLHERMVGDTEEDGWIHNYRCDKCFEEDYHYGYEDLKIGFNG